MPARKLSRLMSSSRCRGSSLVEATVGLVLIIAGVVGGTLLLVNSGLATFYQEKIGFAANEIAHYAANLPTNTDPLPKTRKFAGEFTKSIGLPDCQLDVTRLEIAGEPAVRVTLTASGLSLLGRGDVLPFRLSLSDTAVALRNSWKPDYILNLSLKENFARTVVSVPCYGRRFGRGVSGVGAASALPRNTSGNFWMNWPYGGFNTDLAKGADEFVFGDNTVPTKPF
jgi:hypothetical protein